MSFWWFRISQNEIEATAIDLIERHGASARDEANRLADVGRRLGAARNRAICRRAALHIDARHLNNGTAVSNYGKRMAEIVQLIVEFGRPRAALEQDIRK